MIQYRADLYEGRYTYASYYDKDIVMRFKDNTIIKNYIDRFDNIKWKLFEA